MFQNTESTKCHPLIPLVSHSTEIHLIVGEALGRATLFNHIDYNMLSKYSILIQPTSMDSVAMHLPISTTMCDDCILSVCACDVNGDGKMEILIGTYAKQLCVYKDTGNNKYALQDTHKFQSPVFGTCAVDINKDGAKEVLVCCMFGLSILQPNMKEMQQLLIQRLTALVASLSSQ